MVDRLDEETKKKALDLVAKIDVNALLQYKSGIYTERLPYFVGLMEKYGLDYRNPGHCSIVGRSIEARLQSDSQQIIQLPKEESLEELAGGSMPNFKQLFFSECERVNNSVIASYKKFVYDPETKVCGFYFNRMYYHTLFSELFKKYIHLLIYEGSLSINWYWKGISGYPLYNLKITCRDFKLNFSMDFKDNKFPEMNNGIIGQVYDYYFYNPDVKAKELDHFKRGFDIFRQLPELLEKSLAAGITKSIMADYKQDKKRKKERKKVERKLKDKAIAFEKEALSIAKRLGK